MREGTEAQILIAYPLVNRRIKGVQGGWQGGGGKKENLY